MRLAICPTTSTRRPDWRGLSLANRIARSSPKMPMGVLMKKIDR
jgi:hypothetical protein